MIEDYFLIIVIILTAVALFLPWSKWLTTEYNTQKSYNEGYDAALKSIEEGYDPQKLFNSCYYNVIEYDKWDKGWMDACISKGAIKNE